MLQNLKPILQQAKKHKRGPKAQARPIFVSKKVEIEYTQSLLEIVKFGHDLLKNELHLKQPIGDGAFIGDSWWQDILNNLNQIRQKFGDFVASIAEALAKKMLNKQKKATDEQLRKQIEKITGLDLSVILRDEDIQDAFDQALQANVQLIKSIPQQYMDKVEQVILHGVQAGQSTQQIAAEIAKIGQSTEQRAKLIATDQVAKINSRFSQIRQQNLGITHYTWSTSRDERVRHEHRLRDGQLFAWDNPPSDGHPGMAIRCRCVALPYMDHLFDENAKTPDEIMSEQKLSFDLIQQQNDALLGWLNKSKINHLSGVLMADDKIQAIAKQYNLSLPEQVALRYYTGSGYKQLNAYLRGLSDEHQLAPSVQVLRQALNKLPDYQGGVVIRRDNFPEHMLRQHTLGNIVEYPAFTSATFGKKDVIIEDNSPIRLVITSKHAKQIDWISEFPHESEVLFTSPTKFRVNKAPKKIGDFWQIELIEK